MMLGLSPCQPPPTMTVPPPSGPLASMTAPSPKVVRPLPLMRILPPTPKPVGKLPFAGVGAGEGDGDGAPGKAGNEPESGSGRGKGWRRWAGPDGACSCAKACAPAACAFAATLPDDCTAAWYSPGADKLVDDKSQAADAPEAFCAVRPLAAPTSTASVALGGLAGNPVRNGPCATPRAVLLVNNDEKIPVVFSLYSIILLNKEFVAIF